MDSGMPSLICRLGPVELPNPVMAASGTAGYGTEDLPHLKAERLGALVTKGLSLEPRQGNPPPRIVETPCGMLNAIGLENIGIEAFIRYHLPLLLQKGVRVVVNAFGETEEDYARLASRLDRQPGITALELNVSCPNVKRGGRAFGRDPEALNGLVRRVRCETRLPLWVKLTPDGVDPVASAQASWEGGCDGLTVANTYLGMAVDVERRRPRIGVGTGGLSGPAIKPMTLYRAWRVAKAAPVPVIASGGIVCAMDALEYLIAGARAVQVGSGAFSNPRIYDEVIQGIRDYLGRYGHRSVEEIVGTLEGMEEAVH
ncbi:MAG: dihydroorotate dehydrogenase [Thermodesulfobacteriota bacterium]